MATKFHLLMVVFEHMQKSRIFGYPKTSFSYTSKFHEMFSYT